MKQSSSPICLAVLVWMSCSSCVSSNIDYTDLFPSNTEYDSSILDPHTIYGSPKGGFSRALSTRLASLPLYLPSTAETEAEDDQQQQQNQQQYYRIRDGDGRLFVCRTYLEEELEPSSAQASMFTQAVLFQNDTQSADTTNDAAAGDVENDREPPSSLAPELSHRERRQQLTKSLISLMKEHLSGICTQLHKGWWSYEWCFGGKMSQFHIEIQQPTGELSLESVTKLGLFHNRRMIPQDLIEKKKKKKTEKQQRQGEKVEKDEQTSDSTNNEEDEAEDEDNHDETEEEEVEVEVLVEGEAVTIVPSTPDKKSKDRTAPTKIPKSPITEEERNVFMEQFVDEETPLAVVMDEYVKGDLCTETKKPRKTTAEYRCCSIAQVDKIQSGVLHYSKPIKSNVATIVSLEEPQICQYHVLICTPLLCDGLGELYKDTKLAVKPQPPTTNDKTSSSSAAAAGDDGSSSPSIPDIENESVRSVLKRTLGGICLVLATNQWWAYEFCYGRQIRQFHEEVVMDAMSGSTKKTTSAEFSLGKFTKELDAADLEELDFVVNATDDSGGSDAMTLKKKSSLGSGGGANQPNSDRGNGAYFVQEYTGGTVCENDKTLIERTSGIVRATTIRYFCGPRKELVSMNEDSTCHYEVDITIPELCGHPLFRAPVMKKRVVKCLPAPGEPIG